MAQPYSYMSEPNKPKQTSGQSNNDLYGGQSQWGKDFHVSTQDWNPMQNSGGAGGNTSSSGGGAPQWTPPYQDIFNNPALNDPDTWDIKNNEYGRGIENLLPGRQQAYNEYRGNTDAAEGTRRFDLDFNETVYGNRFNQQLETRRQKAAEMTTADASRLAWGGHALNILNSDRNYDLGSRAADTNQYDARTRRDLGSRELDITATNNLRNYNLGNRELDITAANNVRNYNLGQQANKTNQFDAQTRRTVGLGELDQARIDSNRDFQLGNRAADTNQFNAQTGRLDAQNDYTLGQQANRIDQMWKSGQLTNQQREIKLAELTQTQNEAFRRAQMAQELQMLREQLASQEQQARWSQFGRGQTPNTRWVRSWQ